MAAATDGETPNVEPPVRRSFGRRKCNKGSETASSSMTGGSKKKKTKKVPQRGMGVEKLERQRIQEEWNKMKEQITHQPFLTIPPPPPPPPSQHRYLGFPNSDLHFGIYNHSNAFGFSKELSSTPNSLNCNSLHCNVCHKKKKVNSGNLGSETCGFLGMNFGENRLVVEYAGNNKGGEISSSSASCDVEMGGRMVMQYDFFPLSQKADDEELGMVTCSSSSSPDCVSLDLSLKLSN